MDDQTPATIRASELPAAVPGSALAIEWETYRRAISQLLANGSEGKYVLIKGDQILGLHETWSAARQAGLQRFLAEPFLVQQVRADEPVLRIRGYSLPCRA